MSETPDRLTVSVTLGERSYPIHIGEGLIAEAGTLVATHAPTRQAAIVTDETVEPLYADVLTNRLGAAGIRTIAHTLAAGEATKSFGNLERLLNGLLAEGIERGDVVVALGGGVIGDLAGCAAGLLRRGVRLIQVPTSLLAQVDSSVGGKTGINTKHGKNLVGVFHQPSLVIADTAVLDTLPERQFRAGYAEVVKYGLLGDASFFAWLDANWRDVFSGGAARREAVARCCQAKAAIVAEDEHEAGRRALLNLGHTFGHALEAATGYSDRLIHGEAVAIGMAMAFRFSERLGRVSALDCERVCTHLTDVGLPTKLSDIPGSMPGAEELMAHIRQDKKVTAGALTFILVNAIGDAEVVKDVDPTQVAAHLKDELKLK